MCYNCGCGELDNDHGNEESITNTTLEKLAQDNGQTPQQVAQSMMDALEKKMSADMDSNQAS